MTDSEQLSSLATHLYVRLRRDGGRVIDVIWLMRNQEYAREILKLARSIGEPELDKLGEKIEELMFGANRVPMAKPVPPPPRPITQGTPEAMTEAQASATGRYKGGLR